MHCILRKILPSASAVLPDRAEQEAEATGDAHSYMRV